MTTSPSISLERPPTTSPLLNNLNDHESEAANLDGNDDPGPCSCCLKPIDEGQVILFNNKCWHPACFRCITCENLLDINMNVYLDGEGNPICANCMHNCSICNQPITDFAMMYGKEMYHEECFRCQECHTTISGTVYASTSKGVYCVNCHNERMARSRKHHEERKRRAKERQERKSQRDRLSPNPNVDRDKSLPAPPPEPSPNLSVQSLSPPPLSEAQFQTYLLGGRPNGAAEDELRSKGFPLARNMPAMMETERRLNGVSIDHEKERDSISPKAESLTTDLEADVQTAYIPVVLDKSSLPNSPDPTQLQNVLESPVLGYHTHSPPIANPQIQKLIASEPLKSPIRQESLPPPNLQRKTSISAMAKEATEAIGRKMSLRSRRKNSQTGKEWKLEDIPKRKTSNASMDGVPVSALPRSAIPDFPAPPTTTPLRSAPAEENRTATRSASPPASPVQFMMRNDSVSEVSTAMTPTSMIFDPKNGTAPLNVGSTSPPIPSRHPHHSPKPSVSLPQTTSPTEPVHIKKPTHKKNTTSFISLGSSRPSTAGSDQAPKTPQYTMSPSTYQDESPQLPSIPSTGFLSLEDEMSQMWLQHDRKGSNSSGTPHKRNGSMSSQTGGLLSKVASSIRHNRTNSQDQRTGSHSRQASRGGGTHSRTPSQPGGLAATFLAEAEEEKAALRRQLRKSAHQIVELELKIQDDKVEKVEDRLEGTKDALVGIETEREIALKELKVLLKHRYALQDSTSTAGARESCNAIVKDFEMSLEKLKDSLRDQIREYTAVRAQLLEETSRLRTLRDNYLEEAQHLNKKNDELADLNNDIQRNMDRTPNHSKSTSDSRPGGFSLFTKHRKDSPTNASISSVQSIVHPMFFEPKKSLDGYGLPESPVSRASESTVTADTESTISRAVPTRVSDQDSVDLPPPPKKMNYWRKNTAALTGKAVKGFKSVWSGDPTTVIVTPAPGTTISSPQLISSSSQGNGLNILLPQPSPASTFDSYQSEYYKSHSFHPKAFKRWQKCAYCADKLSGTEVRCTDCDYQCHTKCIMSVTVPCTKSRNRSIRDADSSSLASETSNIFGNDLSRQAELEGRPVPYIITRCIEEVELHGMEYEGIYRKSGGASSLRAIIDAFEAGGDVNFEQLVGSGDICAVTSALKQYLRNLPDPLVPFQVYDRILQAAAGSDHNLKMAKFRGVLDSMPKVNYDCLQLLMLHLARVVDKSDINLMHASNLAVVFSPTIMRDMTGARQISDMQATSTCVKLLIENANALFLPQPHKKTFSLDTRSGDSITGLSRIIDHRI